MYVGRPRKILRTIYLYMAIPLLLVTAVLAMTSMMHHRHHGDGRPAEFKADQPPEWSGSAAASGSGASEMRPRFPPRQPPPPAQPAEEEQSDAAGEAAIITAVATGIAGLLGAVTQTVLAFMKMKERRPKDDQS